MKDYLNSNGLINGKIPAGQTCGYYNECTRKNGYCPGGDHLLEHEFSCALARLHSAVLVSDNELLKKVRDKK